MTMKARKTESKVREQPPVGPQMARLLGIVNLGHQPGFVYQGKKIDSQYKFELTYELVNSLMEDGRPFLISEEVPNKDFEDPKTGRCSTLVARAKCMAPENYKEVLKELTKMLTKPCMVTVSKNENGYAKIAGQAAVSGVPAGLDIPELQNKPFSFDPEDENVDLDMFNSFPEFKQNKIRDALNFEETPLYRKLLEVTDDVTF